MKRKLFLACFTAIVMCLAAPVGAESYRSREVRSLKSRASGGALDNNAISEETLSKEKWNLTIFGLEGAGTLSQALKIKGLVDDVVDFKDTLNFDQANGDYSSLMNKYTSLADLSKRLNLNLGMQTRTELLNFSLNRKWGRFSVGAYGEGDVGARISSPDIDKARLVYNTQNSYIRLEEGKDVVKALARGDAGGAIGFGRVVDIGSMDFAGGIQTRVFRRWLVPMHTIRFNQDLKNKDSIQVPDKFEYLEGMGVDLDVSGTLALNDRFLDTRITLRAENIGKVWYPEMSLLEKPRISAGTSIAPLHALHHDKLTVGLELSEMEEGVTLRTGLKYLLGNEHINFTPRAGFIIGEKDLFEENNNLFTAGFSARLFGLNFVGLYEYNATLGEYNAGGGLSIEI
ncbi:MAG: hypothetical protein V1661_01765 [bacterium]